MNANGTNYSNAVSGTTPSGAPTAPTNLVTTSETLTQIDLSWTDTSDDETNFLMERSIDGTTWIQIAILPADSTTYNDTNVSPNTTYTYRVGAFNANGTNYSNEVTGTTP